MGIKWTEERKKAFSDRMKGDKNPNFGKKHSATAKNSISRKNSGRKKSDAFKEKCSFRMLGENNPNWKGKALSEKSRDRIRKKLTGRKKSTPVSEETRKKLSSSIKKAYAEKPSLHIKPKLSEETKKKISVALKKAYEKNPNLRIQRSGKNSCLWKDDVEKEYPPEFNKTLKRKIKERDQNKCRGLFCPEINSKLMVHHIDFNKKNCGPYNLITLCNICHSQTNHDYSLSMGYRIIAKILTKKYWKELIKKTK